MVNLLLFISAIRNVWVARNPPGFAFVEYEGEWVDTVNDQGCLGAKTRGGSTPDFESDENESPTKLL